MLSAGGYPVELGARLRLPPILPEDALLFAWLREAHRYLAWLLFLTFVAHTRWCYGVRCRPRLASSIRRSASR